ncbi:hypothetical protein SAMN02745174_02559 [Cetobacterium ceti]|uniref:Uncharacterized protein n=1 Tax=Cetobacterium ceti TaxID=180163 RepID=A0A1T4R242_9FUSO|nr:hypothetical protein [Cetobacterium ceti]SKA10090.1 hypothetical protein SAMN02745174_02559 [Cetobacterium ceti]
MKLKNIALFIDSKITELHRNRSNFCLKHKMTKQSFNSLINNLIYENKGAKFSTIEEILNKLGYELVIQKIKK